MQYTPHIRLPLFESTDKPTWLYDWNETMTKLDDVIYEINSSDIPAELAELVARVNALERTVSQHTTDITALQDQALSILGDINQIMSIIPASASPTNKLATMADVEGGSTPVIPIASPTQLGGIKVGQNLTIEADGTLNAQAGGGGSTEPLMTEVGRTTWTNNDRSKTVVFTGLPWESSGFESGFVDARMCIAIYANIFYQTAPYYAGVALPYTLIDTGDVLWYEPEEAHTSGNRSIALSFGDKVITFSTPTSATVGSGTLNMTFPTMTETIGSIDLSTAVDFTAVFYLLADDATTGGSSYTLPPATANTLGGIKVGSGLSVTQDGTLSATGGGSDPQLAQRVTALEGDMSTAQGDITTLQTDMTTAQGNITTLQSDMTTAQSDISTNTTSIQTNAADISQNASDISLLDGRVTTLENAPAYSLPTASASTLGGVKVGSGLSIDGSGVLSATGGAANAASKDDIATLQLTGSTNDSGSTITAGTWFYLNNELVVAKTNIADGATFTLDTNYEKKTIGVELVELNNNSRPSIESAEAIYSDSLNLRTDSIIVKKSFVINNLYYNDYLVIQLPGSGTTNAYAISYFNCPNSENKTGSWGLTTFAFGGYNVYKLLSGQTVTPMNDAATGSANVKFYQDSSNRYMILKFKSSSMMIATFEISIIGSYLARNYITSNITAYTATAIPSGLTEITSWAT